MYTTIERSSLENEKKRLREKEREREKLYYGRSLGIGYGLASLLPPGTAPHPIWLNNPSSERTGGGKQNVVQIFNRENDGPLFPVDRLLLAV